MRPSFLIRARSTSQVGLCSYAAVAPSHDQPAALHSRPALKPASGERELALLPATRPSCLTQARGSSQMGTDMHAAAASSPHPQAARETSRQPGDEQVAQLSAWGPISRPLDCAVPGKPGLTAYRLQRALLDGASMSWPACLHGCSRVTQRVLCSCGTKRAHIHWRRWVREQHLAEDVQRSALPANVQLQQRSQVSHCACCAAVGWRGRAATADAGQGSSSPPDAGLCPDADHSVAAPGGCQRAEPACAVQLWAGEGAQPLETLDEGAAAHLTQDPLTQASLPGRQVCLCMARCVRGQSPSLHLRAARGGNGPPAQQAAGGAG